MAPAPKDSSEPQPASRPALRPAGWLLLPVVIAFAVGIQGSGHPAVAVSWWLIGLLLVALALCQLCRQSGPAFLLLPLLFFCLGGLHGQPPQPPGDPCHLYNLIQDGQTATVSGLLIEAPQASEEKSRLRVKLDGLLTATGMRRASGTVLLTLAGPPPANLVPGGHLLARARFSTISNYKNPGGFDYQRFMADQGIWLSGWINQPALLLPIKTPANESLPSRLAAWPELLRFRLADYLDRQLPPSTGGLYKAILTGMRNSIPSMTDDNFKTIGAYHLLAISGLHVGLLGLLSTLAIAGLIKRSSWLLLRINLWKTSAILSLFPIALYALLAGFQPPVFRAAAMAALFILAFAGNRQPNTANAIATAALLVLIWQPASIHNASFQLSFGAIIAIAAILPQIKEKLLPDPGELAEGWPRRALQRLRGWGIASLLASLAAMLGTLPLQLLHFNRVSPLSPISTLLIEPLLCLWGLLWGIPASCLALLAPDLALPLFAVGGWGITAATGIAALLAGLPGASIWLPTPTWPEVLCYYLLLASFMAWRRTKASSWLGLAALLTLALLVGQRAVSLQGRTTSTITYLDVGQGASSLLELPGGRNILIDGGGSHSDRFNVGERIIAPFLWQRGIMRLDALIVTHPHADHYNGLAFIIRCFKPELVWVSSLDDQPPEYQALLSQARKAGCQVRKAGLDEVLWESKGVSLTNLAGWRDSDRQDPTVGWLARPGDPNNRGLVLQLRHDGSSFLFPGDIGHEAESWLIERHGTNLRADALLVPHHGSATSSSAQFVRHLAPAYAVISGNGKTADPSVLASYREGRSRLMTTAEQGAISITTDGATLSFTSFAGAR